MSFSNVIFNCMSLNFLNGDSMIFFHWKSCHTKIIYYQKWWGLVLRWMFHVTVSLRLCPWIDTNFPGVQPWWLDDCKMVLCPREDQHINHLGEIDLNPPYFYFPWWHNGGAKGFSYTKAENPKTPRFQARWQGFIFETLEQEHLCWVRSSNEYILTYLSENIWKSDNNLQRPRTENTSFALACWSTFLSVQLLHDAIVLPPAMNSPGSHCFFRFGSCLQSWQRYWILFFAKVQSERVLVPILAQYPVGSSIPRGESWLPQPVVSNVNKICRPHCLCYERRLLKTTQVQWLGHEGCHVASRPFQFLRKSASTWLFGLKATALYA